MNPWDNPVAAPSYAAPLMNFAQLGQRPQQMQQPQSPNAPMNINPNQQPQQRYSFQNPNQNGLAAKLMAYLNPPTSPGSFGGTGGGLGGLY